MQNPGRMVPPADQTLTGCGVVADALVSGRRGSVIAALRSV